MPIDLDALRSLVRDSDEVVFEEEDLQAAADASGDNILRAAGIAFKSLAAEYVLLGKSVKTDDLAIDIRSRGKDLLSVAESFFNDAASAEASEGAFIVVPLPARSSRPVRPEGTPWPYGGYC